MRILAVISMLLCFLSILLAAWLPGAALRGGLSALLSLILSTILFVLSDPELKGTK